MTPIRHTVSPLILRWPVLSPCLSPSPPSFSEERSEPIVSIFSLFIKFFTHFSLTSTLVHQPPNCHTQLNPHSKSSFISPRYLIMLVPPQLLNITSGFHGNLLTCLATPFQQTSPTCPTTLTLRCNSSWFHLALWRFTHTIPTFFTTTS